MLAACRTEFELSNTYVFTDYLLQCMYKNLPRKHLDILFDVLGIRKAHNNLEELFALRLGLGHHQRTKPFQVASNAILLLHGEPDGY
jgi:hypothetical protein